MPHEKLTPSFVFDEERLAALRQIAPEAFRDGAVNWEALRLALEGQLEDESADAEHFGLNWPGKRAARRRASALPDAALHPAPGEGVEEDTTHNLFIEADNLDALKLLQKAYAGRVKMIYIDPPYNTGNDFVYRDDFKQTQAAYLQSTGEATASGQPLTTNSKADGRFHSNWLNMMYPRLLLARTLLADDGVIFVSIDDNELQNLYMVMRELYGEENFVSLLIVQTNPRGRTLDRFIAKTHEYIVAFVMPGGEINEIPKSESMMAEYRYRDGGGYYRLLELRNRNPMFHKGNRPNLHYPFFVDPATRAVSLSQGQGYSVGPVLPLNSKEVEGAWTWGVEKAAKNIDLLVGKQVNTGAWRIFRKDYLPEDGATTKAKSIWLEPEINHENGKEQLTGMFDFAPFDFPKSVDLIKKCAILATGSAESDLILDFFAGSGTTAHAVMALNSEDGGNRQFILVQYPEDTPSDSTARNAGYATIADIAKERIRRAAAKIREEKAGQLPVDAPPDLGFRVFKAGLSDVKAWREQEFETVEAVQLAMQSFAASPLADGWTAAGLLAEVLLLQGFPLDSRIEAVAAISGNAVHRVSHAFHEHYLYTCFDVRLKPETVAALAAILRTEHKAVLVCLDSALDDQAKVTLADAGALRTI